MDDPNQSRDADRLIDHYEVMRATVMAGALDGLDVGLVVSKGVAAWITSWRAFVPAATKAHVPKPRPAAARELVDVLAGMALACV